MTGPPDAGILFSADRQGGTGMNRTETYIELYKELEELAVSRYGYPADGRAVYQLQRRPEFKSIREELDYCREVRNLLQHRKRLGDSFPVEPSGAMLELLRSVIARVEAPPRAKDIQVSFPEVLWKTLDGKEFLKKDIL